MINSCYLKSLNLYLSKCELCFSMNQLRHQVEADHKKLKEGETFLYSLQLIRDCY